MAILKALCHIFVLGSICLGTQPKQSFTLVPRTGALILIQNMLVERDAL